MAIVGNSYLPDLHQAFGCKSINYSASIFGIIVQIPLNSDRSECCGKLICKLFTRFDLQGVGGLVIHFSAQISNYLHYLSHA